MPPPTAAALARVVAALPGGGEARPGQVQMAEAVASAFAGRRHLVVQAGTGTGKSLAYLVPAVLSGKRVVVATATKALQDQLAARDLPFLRQHLGVEFSWAVLKGRGNYLCLAKAAEVRGGASTSELDLGERRGLAGELTRLLSWAGDSPTGDRAELPFEPSPRAWQSLSVAPTECPGAANCAHGVECFAERARREASAADVVVVNTALYGTHLAAMGNVLPEHDIVVIDEAHELEDVAATSLGLELTPGRFFALARTARPVLPEAAKGSAELVTQAGAQLEVIIGGLLGRAIGVDPESGIEVEALRTWRDIASERVRTLVQALRDTTSQDSRKARAVQAGGHIVGDLDLIAVLPRSHVLWVEGTQASPVLKVALVDVARSLAERLWGEVTAVLTSATIPPGLPAQVGLPADRTDSLDVGSPFQYRDQAILYVPRHLPDPRQPAYEAAMIEELRWLIGVAGGRCLGLFTSYARMQKAADALRGQLPGPLFVQGELPKPALIDAFSTDEASSLFATMGFWQGIDVPGPSLSLVCIDRLPFPRPDEPLMDARRSRAGDAAFAVIDIPRAATLLAQGAGRLIRSAADHGVVAVLDSRLATKPYRTQLLAPMPPMKRSVSRDEVAAFLTKILGAADRPTSG